MILNAPLRGEFGTQLALDLAENNLGVLLLLPADAYDHVCCKVEDYGVFSLPKPVSRDGFYRAVKLLTAMRGKLLQMDRKQQALKEKMQDIRTVNQAKWLLIENRRMSESDATTSLKSRPWTPGSPAGRWRKASSGPIRDKRNGITVSLTNTGTPACRCPQGKPGEQGFSGFLFFGKKYLI